VFLRQASMLAVPVEMSYIRKWMKHMVKKMYEKDYYELASSQIDLCCLPCFRNFNDDSSIFCSELVRMAMEQLYPNIFYLREGEASDEYTPVDFSTDAYGYSTDIKINFTNYGWGKEKEIKVKVSRK